MNYFGSKRDSDSKFIGKRCALPGGDLKGTIVDSRYFETNLVFAVDFDECSYIIKVFYGDITIHGWDIVKREFNDDPNNSIE